MGREKVKLGEEKAGNGWRYVKMFKGQRWWSKVYPALTRQTKSEAWNTFVQWREHQTEAAPTPAPDNYTLLREMLAAQIQPLAQHAELTGNSKEAKQLREILKSLPRATPDQIKQLIPLFVNDPVIEDRKETAARIHKTTDPELTARALADEFVLRYERKARANRGSWGRAGQVRVGLKIFCEWYGAERSLEHFNETSWKDFSKYLEQMVADQEYSQTTAHDHQKTFQTFISTIAGDYPDSIRIPSNLRSAHHRIPAERKEPVTYSVQEVTLLLEHANPRTRLFLLLMLNCAMYQGDVADLQANEIDWTSGRIIRPRSKTGRLALNRGKSPFKLNWKLWPETFRLLNEFGNRDGLVLRNANGEPLIQHKPTTRNDDIRSAFRRLVDKLKRRELLPIGWHKTLKSFRKTGSNMLADAPDEGIAQFYVLYLDHSSVAHKNYLESGKPNAALDRATTYIGERLGY